MSDWYLFRATLRDLLRPKKLITASLLILFPVFFATMIRFGRFGNRQEAFNAVEIYSNLASFIVFQFIIVILALVFSTGAITQEVEQKTIVYLLTRPIPRWRILLMKFLASMSVTICTAWITCGLVSLICFGGSQSHDPYILRIDQIRNEQAFATQFKETPSPYLLKLTEGFSGRLKERLEKYDPSRPPENRLIADLVANLNRQMRNGRFDKETLLNSDISDALKKRVEQNPKGVERSVVERQALQEVLEGILDPPQAIQNPTQRDLLIVPVAALAYGTVFLLLATFLNRPMIYGLMFAFAWESWVPSMPGNFKRLSLMSYIKVLAPHDRIEANNNANALLSQMTEQIIITERQSWLTMLCVILIALLVALRLFTVREYVPRDDTA
jgi:hypothetical protein